MTSGSSACRFLYCDAHSRCNCRCVMCDIWKREEATEVTANELERHRDSLRRLGVAQVVLSGGEPLMHSDLSRLCSILPRTWHSSHAAHHGLAAGEAGLRSGYAIRRSDHLP